ncbi:hypothetical protein [Streptomyces jeddahensis]|uniref:Uncharacterized protein n=1 Tax=Streptomyces jeddahensis TaxID=1716141 RepID=A0A177HKR8_9ACTN|nr:hypothetical protein [Streptomyces jeddahensis]OAH11475.1 hypothetical protein STSP_51480 [Streptomyces jeddahensis]
MVVSSYYDLDQLRAAMQDVEGVYMITPALDIIRTDAWLTGTPLASTRTSRFSRLSPG